jgi:hypothetical protein
MNRLSTEYPNCTLPGNDLRCGDVVQLFDGPFGTAIVENVTNDAVTFFRPYGTHTDFTTAGGVITYTGTETFSRGLPTDQRYYVWQRNNPR